MQTEKVYIAEIGTNFQDFSMQLVRKASRLKRSFRAIFNDTVLDITPEMNTSAIRKQYDRKRQVKYHG